MVIVILNWLYIGFTSFLTGYAVLSLFTRFTGYKIKYLITPFFAGLTAVTVYAQLFSLFGGVGVLANGILLFACFLIQIFMRDEISGFVWRKLSGAGVKKFIFAGILLLLFSYGTSRGYMHFDTGLYHAQSIRWIEEYGVVPGLANLQARFAYNSAAFPLTALYSMVDLTGHSLHTTAGFFAFISSFLAFDLTHIFTNKQVRLSDFVRIGLIFYLGIIYSQMVSPASDYYAQLLIYDSLILWLDMEEGQEQKEKMVCSYAPYALILFLLVYAVTIKFSVATMLLLIVLPAAVLLKNRDIKGIVVSLLTGICILLPFLIRNVIISGWLVYPSTILDLFKVDWKVPKGQVQYDAMEIGVYGRGINDVTKQDTPFMQWLIPWFENLKGLEKLWVLLSAAALVIGTVYLLWRWIGYAADRRSGKIPDKTFTLVFASVCVSAVFWFVSAPLIRYGYAYITLLPLITFGYFYIRLTERIKKKQVHGAFCVVLVLFLLTRVKGVTWDILRTWQQDYYLMQLDYGDGEATVYEVDGVAIYVPTDNGQIGYYKFPSSPLIQNIELRGKDLKEGFRQKNQ